MNIAITGANGLVGSRIVELLRDEFTFIPLNHSEVDITDQKQVHKKLNDIDFDLLLHMAAYTNVDKAEEEKIIVHKLNVDATKYLFNEVHTLNKKMIYVSTDFVFDGKNPPFDENSKSNPVGYYGQSKYDGELVLEKKAMVVRITYPYGSSPSPKKDFVQKIRSYLANDKSLSMVTDSLMTPTYIDDITLALKYLMNNFSPEIFHIIGSKSYSPFEVGKMIAEHYQLPEWLIQPTTFEEYSKGKSPRPQFAETKSIKNTFYEMRSFGEGLQYLT
ncbi:MAG: SDR family oxidoreductase [Candidatus Roizmanbacteria bacterium]|nr:SDR family oxidoreductase [Candidatus Roizmanbacteria bacterium]